MGKVKTFVCLFCTLHIKGEILITEGQKKTRCRRETSCFDTWIVSHSVGDERQIGLCLTNVRNTKGKHHLGLTSHAGRNCGSEEKKMDP